MSRAFRPSGVDAVLADARPVPAVGKAALTLFLYLEVLDAAFSFDGVTGAFAITSDPVVIALGLGLVGAMFVRSITIYLVHQEALDRYVYLEHGAHWAIGALAVIMLLSIEPRLEIPEAVTASVGVVFIGAAFAWSVLRNRRQARSAAGAELAESVSLGLEPLDRALHLGLGFGAAHPVGGLHELARLQVLVVHEEVLDRVQFEGRNVARCPGCGPSGGRRPARTAPCRRRPLVDHLEHPHRPHLTSTPGNTDSGSSTSASSGSPSSPRVSSMKP